MEASLGWWERGEQRAFTGIMRDVSDRNATLLALELSHARYHAVVANLPNVIVALYDTDERLLLMEGGHMAQRGPAQRGVRRPAARRGAAAPSTPPSSSRTCARALAATSGEFEIDSPDGCYEVHVAPLRGEDARDDRRGSRGARRQRAAPGAPQPRGAGARARALQRRAGRVRLRRLARPLRAAAHDHRLPAAAAAPLRRRARAARPTSTCSPRSRAPTGCAR